MESRRSGVITMVVLVVIIVLVAFAVYYVRTNAANNARLESAAGVAFADSDSVFTDLSGKSVDLFSDEPAITVAFTWASWCPQCKQDLEHLSQLAAQFQDTPVPVRFLAINRQEPTATAERFLATVNSQAYLTLVIDTEDKYYASMNGYAMPELVLFDVDGNERLRQRGAVDIPQLESAIRAELSSDE